MTEEAQPYLNTLRWHACDPSATTGDTRLPFSQSSSWLSHSSVSESSIDFFKISCAGTHPTPWTNGHSLMPSAHNTHSMQASPNTLERYRAHARHLLLRGILCAHCLPWACHSPHTQLSDQLTSTRPSSTAKAEKATKAVKKPVAVVITTVVFTKLRGIWFVVITVVITTKIL